MHERRMVLGAVAVIALALWTHRSDAQQSPDKSAGRRLAESWCGTCHIVTPETASAVSNGVPTFVGIARNEATRADSLRAFLQTPHAGMPDLHLSREEIDDLIAYILGLRGK